MPIMAKHVTVDDDVNYVDDEEEEKMMMMMIMMMKMKMMCIFKGSAFRC